MIRSLPVAGLLVGLALLGSSAALPAQQFKGRLGQAGVPAQAPAFNTPLPMIQKQQQAAGLIPNPAGGAPLMNNGTNLINNNNGANLAALANQNNQFNTNQFNTNQFNNPYANNAYGYNMYNSGYGNPYMNPAMNGNPYWFWGTGMPTGGYTPFYPQYISPQYMLNMQALNNPHLNSLSNPAMSYPFPAGAMNSSWALGQLGVANILNQYPQLGNTPSVGSNPMGQQFP